MRKKEPRGKIMSIQKLGSNDNSRNNSHQCSKKGISKRHSNFTGWEAGGEVSKTPFNYERAMNPGITLQTERTSPENVNGNGLESD